jgi:hypothetical protein
MHGNECVYYLISFMDHCWEIKIYIDIVIVIISSIPLHSLCIS